MLKTKIDRTMIWLAFAAAVAAIGLLLVFYWDTKLELDNLSTPVWTVDRQPTATPTSEASTATVTPTTTTDATAGWKTYTNSKNAYSIKYPADWLLDTQYIKDNTLYLLTRERKQKIDANEIVRMFDVSVTVYQNASELPNNETKKLNFENWIKQEADHYGFIQRKSIIVDGVNGYQGISTSEGTSYIIMVQKGALIYEIDAADTDIPTGTQLKVINTFKFTI